MKQEDFKLQDMAEILTQVTGRDLSDLKAEDYLVRDLDLASIEIVDFIFELERKYHLGIQIGDFFKDSDSGQNYQRDFQIRDVLEILKAKV